MIKGSGIEASYCIAGNFCRSLFLEILETSRIFQKNFLQNGALKFLKPVAKKEKITKNIFPKYSLKRIFQKFKFAKISGYMVYHKHS